MSSSTPRAAPAALAPMPRGWISLALIGWGLFTDSVAGAVVMALMLEGIGLSPVKWAMRRRDFHRAADLTSVVFGVVTVLQFSRYSVHGIYEILAVVPYCFFPLVLAQRASTTRAVPMSALFYSLRRYPEQDRDLDLAPPYIVGCILAASTGDHRGYAFIAFAAVLVVGLLAAARPRRYRWWQWSATLALALLLAGATQLAVLRGQQSLEQAFMYWIRQFPFSSGDPNRAATAIGAIGRLKLSDQIRVRVTPTSRVEFPLLLQEASYDEFRFGSWKAADAGFEALDKLAGREAWITNTAPARAEEPVEITVQHRRELTVLPVPRGTRRVASAEIAELQQNRFGTTMAESPPGALRLLAYHGDPAGIEPPPTAGDRVVPEAYAEVIEATKREIGLSPGDDAANAERIRQFFLDNFRYSLIQRGSYTWRTPLAHFLTETRRGHCEFFASASVLLLRGAGIPARYAVGYVVEEYSELERAYIARARHAHAWAIAWVDGRWVTVDSTPATWFELEDAYASDWQIVQDLGAWAWYRLQRLGQADFSEMSGVLLWLVPPLALVLYLRLRKADTAVREDATPGTGATPPSRLAEVLALLEARGLEPGPGETMARFLRRALPALGPDTDVDGLLAAYYRLRFAPQPAASPDEQAVRDAVRRLTAGSAR
ncbi:MAG: DUF4129 domain-containing transglutaminase family protein [Gammaproteobacteria bacterium]